MLEDKKYKSCSHISFEIIDCQVFSSTSKSFYKKIYQTKIMRLSKIIQLQKDHIFLQAFIVVQFLILVVNKRISYASDHYDVIKIYNYFHFPIPLFSVQLNLMMFPITVDYVINSIRNCRVCVMLIVQDTSEHSNLKHDSIIRYYNDIAKRLTL